MANITEHTEIHTQPNALVLEAKAAETWDKSLGMCLSYSLAVRAQDTEASVRHPGAAASWTQYSLSSSGLPSGSTPQRRLLRTDAYQQ